MWGTQDRLIRVTEFSEVTGLLANSRGLSGDFDAHGTGGALYALHRGLDRDRVQIRHLLLGDFDDLLFAQLANLVLVGGAGALGQVCSLLQPRGEVPGLTY